MTTKPCSKTSYILDQIKERKKASYILKLEGNKFKSNKKKLCIDVPILNFL